MEVNKYSWSCYISHLQWTTIEKGVYKQDEGWYYQNPASVVK